MISRFGQPVSELPSKQVIEFYDILSRRISDAIQEIAEAAFLRSEQLELRMKHITSLNRILDESIRRSSTKRRGTLSKTDIEMEDMIASWVSQNPEIARYVNRAINSSYRFATMDWNDPRPAEADWYVAP